MDAIAQLWRSPTQIRDMVKDVAAFGCRIGNIEILWNPGVTIWSKKSWNSEDAVFHPTTHGWLRNEKINSQNDLDWPGWLLLLKRKEVQGRLKSFEDHLFGCCFMQPWSSKNIYLFFFWGGLSTTCFKIPQNEGSAPSFELFRLFTGAET